MHRVFRQSHLPAPRRPPPIDRVIAYAVKGERGFRHSLTSVRAVWPLSKEQLAQEEQPSKGVRDSSHRVLSSADGAEESI